MAIHRIVNGFIIREGRVRLRPVTNRERDAATHLIGGFEIGMTQDNLARGTVVWFLGNKFGIKVPGGVELGPELLGTVPRGFWTKLEDDLRESARIDRQKYINEDDKHFCIYHLQIADESLACVLVRTDVFVGAGVMRRAFTLSLNKCQNIWIDPTDPGRGYMCTKL